MASEVKTAKNSKLPKLLENCFERVGKGGWPLISTWIIEGMSHYVPLMWEGVLTYRLHVPLYLRLQRVHNTEVPAWHKLPFLGNSSWA
jgi:hypothetical protein